MSLLINVPSRTVFFFFFCLFIYNFLTIILNVEILINDLCVFQIQTVYRHMKESGERAYSLRTNWKHSQGVSVLQIFSKYFQIESLNLFAY